MAATPSFAGTPRTAVVQVSVANTARDGTGTLATVFTAGVNGSRIDAIAMVSTGVTIAGVVRLFIHDGTNSRLWREVMVQAITPSASVPVWRAELDNLALVLQSPSWSLRASTDAANTFNVLVTRAGDF